jgi:predicted ATP-grasp superfamily ATP-dependent carboligase
MRDSEDIKRVKEIVNEGGEKFLFVCNDVVNALSMPDIFDDFCVISYERSPVADALRERGAGVYLLKDDHPGYDKLKSTNNLVSHQFFKETVLNKGTGEKNLLVFKNSLIVEEYARSLGLKLLMAESGISRGIENKVKFYDELKAEGINVLPGATMTMSDDVEYGELVSEYGDPFVLQAAKGFAGAKTYLVKSGADFAAVKEAYAKRKMRLTKFIDGVTVTINACATKLGCVVKPPFYQLTGINSLTGNEMGACGNDFDIATLARPVVDDIVAATVRIGEIIYKKGFRGLFGIDYIVNDGRSWFIECNPRFVTSLPAFTAMELENDEVPLIAFHVLENMDKTDRVADIINKYKTVSGVYSGAQLILHNLTDKPGVVKSELKCGIYRFTGGSLTFLRDALTRDEISSDDEMLILTKARGSTVNPGMECARILTKGGGIVDNALDGKIVAAVRVLYNNIF